MHSAQSVLRARKKTNDFVILAVTDSGLKRLLLWSTNRKERELPLVEPVGGLAIVYHASPEQYAKGRLLELDDHALVARVLDGDDLSFEVLMDRYTPMVVGYLYGKAGSECDVQDLGQEIFLTAFRNLHSLRSRDRFGCWIMRIAHTRLIDHYRANSRKPQTVSLEIGEEGEESRTQQVPDSAPGPAARASESQVRDIIFDEIGKMGEKYQVVLYNRLIGGDQVDEIAQRLGIRESAVRMRLLRGLRMLRKALRKYNISLEA